MKNSTMERFKDQSIHDSKTVSVVSCDKDRQPTGVLTNTRCETVVLLLSSREPTPIAWTYHPSTYELETQVDKCKQCIK